MKLSQNFHLAEFVSSQTAQRRNIDNTPSSDVLANLQKTAEMMERVRAVLGSPILISSGYRSAALNKAIGGSINSQHTKGQAVDFTSPGFGEPREIVEAIRKSDIPYDQLILEFGQWVHISFASKPRKQALVIDRNGTRALA